MNLRVFYLTRRGISDGYERTNCSYLRQQNEERHDATKQRRIDMVQRNEKPSQQSCWKGFHLKIRWRRPTLPLAQYHRRGRA